MRGMEHSTASRRTAPANATQTGRPAKAYGDRNFEQTKVPGLGSGPILPECLRKLFRHKDTPAAKRS